MAQQFIRLNYTTLHGKPVHLLETAERFREHCVTSELDSTLPLDVLIEQYAALFPRSKMTGFVVDFSNLDQKR